MAKPELGNKHQCQNCGTRYFDLNRSPITCPKCGTVCEDLPRAAQHAAEAEEEEIPVNAETELVPLEEADLEEEKDVIVPGEDVEIDADEDTFLEEEEEDDSDVGDLIDGDIGDDEER
ncbi:MAG TPA: TIGR02300 family protein [Methylocella sp.]|nr:TIGR02300 family protein [Methylocella sp.]